MLTAGFFSGVGYFFICDEPYPDLLIPTTVVVPFISITFGLTFISPDLFVLEVLGLLGLLGGLESAGLGYYFLTSGLGLRTGGPPIPPKSILSRSF